MSQIVSTPLASLISDAHPPRSRALRRVHQAGCALLPAFGLKLRAFGHALADEGREARRIARFLAPQLAELARRTAADGLTLTAAALFAVGFPLSLYALATAVPS